MNPARGGAQPFAAGAVEVAREIVALNGNGERVGAVDTVLMPRRRASSQLRLTGNLAVRW